MEVSVGAWGGHVDLHGATKVKTFMWYIQVVDAANWVVYMLPPATETLKNLRKNARNPKK